jgi:hypothetical protein
MWEILLLDFLNVRHSDAGLFSSWTNEQGKPFKNLGSKSKEAAS